MKSILMILAMVLGMVILAGCGPSTEQIAMMTASAWTPTPPPPTPVPYDLTVSVTGVDGSPLAGAAVVFPESGTGEPVLTNDQGSADWTNLPGEAASLTVSAQGYLTSHQTTTLQRGPNAFSVALERDPYGLLPTSACGPGENFQYMDDFQDGIAQENSAFAQNLAGASLGDAPNEPGNTSLILDSSQGAPGEWLGSNLDWNRYAFGDAAWRLRFMINQPTALSFNWNEHGPSEFDGQEVQSTVYNVLLRGSPANTINLVRNVFGPNGEPISGKSGQVASGTFTMVPGQWHFMEISTFQGHTQVWIDGKSELEYQDPTPLPAGSIGAWFAGPVETGNTSITYLDSYSVCGLSAPFASMASPVPVTIP